MTPVGRNVWAIAEGYIPGKSMNETHEFVSHEAACMLNNSENDAHVEITIFFTDRDPIGPYAVIVPARRTLHMRFNDLTDPEPIPRDTSYSSLIVSDTPIVVQHTRLDSRDPHIALISTTAFAAS
jgi:hypothetical protein